MRSDFSSNFSTKLPVLILNSVFSKISLLYSGCLKKNQNTPIDLLSIVGLARLCLCFTYNLGANTTRGNSARVKLQVWVRVVLRPVRSLLVAASTLPAGP